MSSQNPQKIANNLEYKAAIKTIRHFAKGFRGAEGYDLRKPWKDLPKYQRAKLRRYFNIIDPLTAHPFKAVRPRRKDRLKTLQKFSGQTDFPKGMTTAIVPVADPTEKLEVKYSKDNKKVHNIMEGNVGRTIIEFISDILINDPSLAVNLAIAQLPSDTRRLMLMAGDHLIARPIGANFDSLLQAVQYYQGRYGTDNFDPRNKNSHYFGNWMKGIYTYQFKELGTWQQYHQDMMKVKNLLRIVRTTKSKTKRAKAQKQLQKYDLKSYRDRTNRKQR